MHPVSGLSELDLGGSRGRHGMVKYTPVSRNDTTVSLGVVQWVMRNEMVACAEDRVTEVFG
jgi:hypothetical protein